ncbi:MAG: DUF1302 family protein [Spirochaetota bacterium]
MKRTTRVRWLRGLAVLCAAALLAVAPATAQAQDEEEGGGSFFEEDDHAAEEEERGDGSTRVGGEVELELRAYPEWDDADELADSETEAVPRVRTEFVHEGRSSEAVAQLEYSSRILEGIGVSGSPADGASMDVGMLVEELIDEAYIQLFYDNLDVEFGYLKTTWGTGDEVHVVDVLNPMDFTDFMNPDYNDRKLAEKMVKLNIYTGPQGLLELAYVPVLGQDRYATEGRWRPYSFDALEEYLYEIAAVPTNLFDKEDAKAVLAEITTEAATAAEPASLSDGQYGLRYSTSVGGVDLGAVYYFGFIREPAISVPETDPEDYHVGFDRVNLFGLEFATVLSGFNLRAEAAYKMTEDFAGDDPEVHNHRIAYMGGFDRDLPVSSINMNIQAQGEYILHSDEVSDNGPADTDYDPGDDEHYWTNTLVASVEDRYRNDTVIPQVDFVMTAETRDFLLRPGVEFVLADDASLNVRGSMFEGDEDTQFGRFDDNDHLEMSIEYAF